MRRKIDRVVKAMHRAVGEIEKSNNRVRRKVMEQAKRKAGLQHKLNMIGL